MLADIAGGEGSDSNTGLITVAAMDVHLDELLQQALARERRTAEDDSDGEGGDIDPPPCTFVMPSSPLTTPPTSPESTPEFKPTDITMPVPSLSNLPPPATQPAANNHSVAGRFAPNTLGTGESRKRKQQEGKKKRQSKKRKTEQEQRDPLWYRMRASLARKWSQPHRFKVAFPISNLRGSRGAFVGVRHLTKRLTPWTLKELLEAGFRLIEWDGRTPYAIVIDGDRILVMLCGRPSDADWDGVTQELTKVLLEAGQEARMTDPKPRRGPHIAVTTGASMGGGSTVSLLFS